MLKPNLYGEKSWCEALGFVRNKAQANIDTIVCWRWRNKDRRPWCDPWKREFSTSNLDYLIVNGIHHQPLHKREPRRAIGREHIIEEAWRLHDPSWTWSIEESKWCSIWIDELLHSKDMVMCYMPLKHLVLELDGQMIWPFFNMFLK